MRVEVFTSPEAMAAATAGFIVAQAEKVKGAGRFSLVLAGGTTPLAAYRLLGRPPRADSMPWPRLHLFWSDERCVAMSHPESNAGAALAALGPPQALPRGNIHPIPANLGPRPGAEAYERELRTFFEPMGAPTFDLVLLGLGPDGHTASIFPGSPALDVMDRWVLGVPAPAHLEPRVARVTLALATINAAWTVLFLVSGPAKADAVRKILSPSFDAAKTLPAARVKPQGDLAWFLDRDAARGLEERP